MRNDLHPISATGDKRMNHEIRAAVRGVYDIQKLRIATGNRIVAQFYSNDEDDEAAKARFLTTLVKDHERLTDGLIRPISLKRFTAEGSISSYPLFTLVQGYRNLLKSEHEQFLMLKHLCEAEPLWHAFLKDIKGIGPAMAGVLLSEINIVTARYPSSLFRYAGLDVAEDGKGRSSRKEHLVDVAYTTKSGETALKKSLTHNRFLKTKLMGVLAPSFLKQGDSPYRKIYDDYKNRLVNRPDCAELSKLHIHNRAMRYMIKMFLVDLYMAWRPLEGQERFGTYAEEKLDIRHRPHAA